MKFYEGLDLLTKGFNFRYPAITQQIMSVVIFLDSSAMIQDTID